MSGTKLTPLLSAHKDVYVAGSNVGKIRAVKEKENEDSDHTVLVLGTPNTMGATGAGSTKQHPTLELVMCAGACYKLSQPPMPPPPPKPASRGPTPPPEGSENYGPALLNKKEDVSVPAPPPVLKWRLPYSQVLHVYTLEDWWKSIGKRDTPPPPGGAPPPQPSATAPSGGGFKSTWEEQMARGFVIEYVSEKNRPKKVEKYPPMVRHHIGALTGGGEGGAYRPYQLPNIRYRFFTAPSIVEQQEWVILFNSALCNYWQERLEASIVPDPDVFQFHTWGLVKVGGGQQLAHIVVSTTTIHIVPCPQLPSSLKDEGSVANRQSVAMGNIVSCDLKKVGNENGVPGATVKITTRPPTPLLESGVVFFTAALGMEFLVELQRVWGFTSRREEPFPFQ